MTKRQNKKNKTYRKLNNRLKSAIANMAQAMVRTTRTPPIKWFSLNTKGGNP